MPTSQRAFRCLQCRVRSINRLQVRGYHESKRVQAESAPPSIAPKTIIDIKHIRQNPTLYEKSSRERNYERQAQHPALIIKHFERWQEIQHSARTLRESNNKLKLELKRQSHDSQNSSPASKEKLIAEARILKEQLTEIEREESVLTSEINALAAEIPNLTSEETPRGDEPKVVGYINEHPDHTSARRTWRPHTYIGSELNLLDFSGAATTTGWGWYFLLNEAAQLEQALVQYALSTARKHGWGMVTPPSMVYSHIAAACGFQPRGSENQIYSIQGKDGSPDLCLAGTAEIPLAGMKANTTFEELELPLRHVGVSRSYRAEAGARGANTKGLYRVHEFTKVEMFAWTLPNATASTEVFDEMLAMQIKILQSLGLHCRILEMPSTDLGASASRKCDIEAYFPSRLEKYDGWGEVTSVSTCTDYQSRRLATKVDLRSQGGKNAFPYTVNGTALAVPRVLAAILENGWDEATRTVKIPDVLLPWMDGVEVIGPKVRV